ncbi:MAG TPA: hypothetical protein VGH80_12855 [Xanthomonadaceae bacterium]|jgi:endonuclease III
MPSSHAFAPGDTLVEAIASLRAFHGRPPLLPTSDPFELVLLENVAYLASAARRRQAFEVLRQTIGTTPEAILDATPESLEAVAAHGILKSRFADKLRLCAQIAMEVSGGDLAQALRGPIENARRVLRRFPGIGVPTADKILLFSGRLACLAPESNGLRVLARLGFVDERQPYARMYRTSLDLQRALPAEVPVLQEAHLLLHQHGQVLCKNSSPRCGECPLAGGCAHARRSSARVS